MNNNINDFNKKLLSIFQVDITELLNNKFQLMVQDTKTTTDVVNSWYYWEYEMFIKLLNQKNKDEKEQQDKQDKEQQGKYGNMSNFNPNKIMGSMSPGNIPGSNMSNYPRY